jgi:hypothetical protein
MAIRKAPLQRPRRLHLRLSVVGVRPRTARALAYNLANFMGTLVLPEDGRTMVADHPREKIVKIGAKVVRMSGPWLRVHLAL